MDEPRKGPKRRTDAEIRAILEAEPRNADGCWERQGGTQHGYAKIGYRGGRCYAHRVAWEVFRGSIPEGMYVCHRCDNRRCVNPGHLFIGTQKDNIADMFAKGRQSTSAQRKTHGNARVSPEDVRAIRALYDADFSQQQIADLFGLNQTAISKIVRRATWKDLE